MTSNMTHHNISQCKTEKYHLHIYSMRVFTLPPYVCVTAPVAGADEYLAYFIAAHCMLHAI